MSDGSEADRRRRDSIYEREQVIPEQLLHDLAHVEDFAGSHRGDLTDAELLAVLHLSHGLSVKMIAATLGKSPETVKRQIRTARASLNAKTAAHLVAVALRLGLID